MSPIDVEHLDPVVVGIGHQDPVGIGHGNVVGVIQLTNSPPVAPELADESTVGLEHLWVIIKVLNCCCLLSIYYVGKRDTNLYPVVLLITYVYEAKGVCRHSPRVVELAVRCSL